MRKKLILFLMLALFGSANFLRADEVTIGDPTSTTTSSYLPGYSLYDYAISQQIYTADEIGMGGTINSLTMWLKNTSSYARNYNIYMKEVSETAFADATSWVSMTASDMVGSYVLNNNITDPVESTITLTTPFAYTGTGSLVICVQDATGQWSSGAVGVTMAATGNQAIYAYRDGTIYDPTTPGVNGTLTTNKNVVRLDITTGGSGSVTNDVTIGDGTATTYYTPFNSLYGYSFTEQIYLASEIGTAGNITSVSFYLGTANTSADQTNEYTMFMKNVSRETFADNTDYETVTASDIVFEGTWTIPMNTTGWLTINLDTPFAYDGTSNLMIGLHEKTGGYSTRYFTYTTTNNSVFQGYSDSYNPDPYDMGSYSGTKTVRNQRSNIQLSITTSTGGGWNPDPNTPIVEVILTAPDNLVDNVASPVTLEWENDDNATMYQVRCGTTYTNASNLDQLEIVQDWDTITGKNGRLQVELYPNIRYYWAVLNMNDAGTVASEVRTFTSEFTAPTNVKVIPNEIFTDESTLVKWSIIGGAIADLPETQIGSGTGVSPYLPTYNLYDYSLTEQIYTVDEIGNAGIINSITFLPAGSITRNLQVYMINTDKTSFTGATDWVAVTADDLVFSGSVAMAAPQTTITLDEPFTFDGTNLLIVVNDITGTWTSSISYSTFDAASQAINIYQDGTAYNPLAPSGSGTVRAFKNQIIINAGAKGNRDLQGCNVYVVTPTDTLLMNTDGPITERQYTLEASQLGADAYNMPDGYQVCVSGLYDYGESSLTPAATPLYISGYTTVNGTVQELMEATPMAGVTVKLSGKDEFNNTVNYQTTTIANGSYEFPNVKCGNYTVTATKDGFEPAVVENVAANYGVTTTVDILYMHESYIPVYKVYAEEGETLGAPVADVIWSFQNFTNPNPGGNTGNNGNGSTFTEGFESGMPAGWTVIDGNNDGYTWCLTSAIPSTWTYYASLTLDWYRTGTNAICSGSYINGVGAITPNEYLVTNQVTLDAGSTFSFWAAATDASYPADHFGVFVSDNATDWSNATMVNEWTLTAKSGGNNGGRASRDGNGAKLGTWHQYTVDLSEYAGEKYIAIRHFNCNDQYIMVVDDIELTSGSKAGNSTADECGKHYQSVSSRNMWDLLASFDCTSGYQYGVATDGNNIYTCSWSSASTSQFYKYDMEGNFIEEFNVSGSGQIRDLTYDGEYFYGVANSNTIYCLDLANKTLVGTITSAYGAMRCCGYDSERDGFWVVGNWSGNLSMVDRTGAVQITGPEPTSASGVAYYKDADGVEHVYCFNNGNNNIDDYNIATNTINSGVFNFNSTPGYDAGSSGGCHIANYNGKLAFFGDLQQSPNIIGIYELGEEQNTGPTVNGSHQDTAYMHYFQVYRKPVLIESMPDDPETLVVLLADEYGIDFADTLYTDLDYDALEAGIYEYGVQAVYPWINRSDDNFTGIVWSNDLDHNMGANLTINGTCALGVDQIVGAVVTLANNDEDVEFTAELDEEGTWTTEEFRKGHYTMTVDMPGFIALYGEGADIDTVPADGLVLNLWNTNEINITFVEDLAPITSLVVSNTGFARWTDMLPHDRVAQRYHVMCNEIFQGETTNNYMILNTEDLIPGETYTAAVAVIYETGMSEFVTADFVYMDCGGVATQVDSLAATVDLTDVTLTWTDGNGTGPTPPTPGNGSTFTEGFESGLPTGWTVTDANGDGWTWCLTSAIPTTWTYYASLTLDWYRTGSNAICSGSYINGVGALNPDEYLITNQVTLVAGSTFSFWAAATDASYPADHFGVFVSDNGTSNWTSVQEWTLTAKSGGNDGGRASRDGNGAKLGTWYQYTVDLSAYAGEKYIAIRHFNCTDQYIMVVDDIELSAGSKSGNFMAAGHGFGLANNSLTDDGNWYYYDNGVNEDAIGTNGGNFWWGIMLPAGTYEGNSVTKVAAYDYMAMTGTASIYQGGTTAPAGDALGTVNVTFTGSTDFVEFPFADAITIDPTQNVWVVFYNGSGATYPAAVCNNTGSANGRWVSLDGTTWEDLASYGLDYTFMVRVYIEAGSAPGPGPSNLSITPNAFNIFQDGVFIGATTDKTFTWIEDDADEHEYCVMYVDADYNFSCAMCITVAADPWGVGELNVVSAIYPNPTNGNLYINTNAEMKSINIVNMLGQMVYNKTTNGTETIIDMAQFGNGIYVVNIVTENGTSVNRIVVNK